MVSQWFPFSLPGVSFLNCFEALVDDPKATSVLGRWARNRHWTSRTLRPAACVVSEPTTCDLPAGCTEHEQLGDRQLAQTFRMVDFVQLGYALQEQVGPRSHSLRTAGFERAVRQYAAEARPAEPE